MTRRVLYQGGEMDSVEMALGNGNVNFDHFNPLYSDCCLRADPGNTYNCLFYDEATQEPASVPDSGSTIFVHSWYRSGSSGESNNHGPFTLFNTDGKPVIRLALLASGLLTLQHNSTPSSAPSWQTIASYPQVFATQYDIDISITTGASKSAAFFSNGVLRASGNFTNGAIGNINMLQLSSGAAELYLSQVMVTEDYPTIGGQLRTRKANGTGVVSGWTGTYSNLVKTTLNDATSVFSDTDGQIFTAAYQDNTTPSGLEIASVWVWNRLKNDGSTPTSMESICRVGGTNYKTALLSGVSSGFVMRPSAWPKNPATSAAWTDTEWNGAEIGMESGS